MVSVVITTYNRFEQCQYAITSVINQTYTPTEIIVIEDNSDSGIKDWLKKKYPNIKYQRNKENVGLAASRNVGVKIACSDWVAFLDDDDIWLPNRLEEQVKVIKSLSNVELDKVACIQVGTKQTHYNDKTVIYNLPRNNGHLITSIKKFGLSTPSSSFLFNKKILENVGLFDTDLKSGIDHDIWMKIATNDYHTRAILKPLVKVNSSSRNNMMSDTYNRIDGLSKFIHKWEDSFIRIYGQEYAKEKIKDYYLDVIGRLAGEKLYNRKYNEFMYCTKNLISKRISYIKIIKKIVKVVTFNVSPEYYIKISTYRS